MRSFPRLRKKISRALNLKLNHGLIVMKIIAAVNNYCTVYCMHYAFHQMGQEKIRGFAGVQRKDFF